MLVVFIDAREPGNPDNNMRETQFLAQPEKFSEFIVSELVKYIDAAHRTQTTPDARGLVGTSYGGVFTTYAGLRYPEVFGKLAIFSPAYWVLENPDGSGNADYAAGARRMNEFVQNQLATKVATTPESTSVATTPETTRVGTTASKIFMSAGIPNWDVGDLEFMAAPLRARGDTVQVFQVQEGHSWGAWSGLTDEMLEYLFAN
jgi:enterochelin esterase-like enzyme